MLFYGGDMRHLFLLFTAFLLAACTQTASVETAQTEAPKAAEAARDFVEGRDYRRLEQTIEGAPEVIELFYYGCRACYHLTDELDDWSRDQKITLSLVPAHGQNHLVDGARLFHTLGVLGRLDLHRDAYVLFQEPSELEGQDRINAMLDVQGVAREDFWNTWSSDAVNERLAGSYQLTSLAGVQSTPSFIVQGKYVVEFGVIDGSEGLLSLLEHLVKAGE